MGKNKVKTLCPVCGNYYFVPLTDEEIAMGMKPEDDFCTSCGWRYDEKQLVDFDLATELNSQSINERKEWFEKQVEINPKFNYLESIQEVPIPHKCPICGKYEFAQEISYDICPFCGWEDSGFDDIDHRDEPFNIDGKTFNQYKKEYDEIISKNPNYKWKNQFK